MTMPKQIDVKVTKPHKDNEELKNVLLSPWLPVVKNANWKLDKNNICDTDPFFKKCIDRPWLVDTKDQ